MLSHTIGHFAVNTELYLCERDKGSKSKRTFDIFHYRDQISKSENPEQTRQELIADYKEKFTTPYIAASRGYLDDVIDPADTRVQIINALDMLQNKWDSLPPKKHGNIPL